MALRIRTFHSIFAKMASTQFHWQVKEWDFMVLNQMWSHLCLLFIYYNNVTIEFLSCYVLFTYQIMGILRTSRLRPLNWTTSIRCFVYLCSYCLPVDCYDCHNSHQIFRTITNERLIQRLKMYASFWTVVPIANNGQNSKIQSQIVKSRFL